MASGACDCSRPVVCKPNAEFPSGATTIHVGQRHSLKASLTSYCNGYAVKPTQVQVMLVDPDNRGAPGALTFTEVQQVPYGPEGGENITVAQSIVSFTPDLPGSWTMTVRFDPSLGEAKYAFEAIAFRDAGVTRIVDVPAMPDCVQYGLTAQGTLLCGREGALVTDRGQSLAGQAFAVRGDVVWRLTGDAGHLLERWVDDGGTLMVTHRGPSDAVAIAATDDAAWGVALTPRDVGPEPPAQLIEAWPEPDGGLGSRSRDLSRAVTEVAVAAGPNGVAAFGSHYGSPFVSVVLRDGGVAETQLEPSHKVAGSDADTLWLRNGVRLTAVATRASIADGAFEANRRPWVLTPFSPALPMDRPSLTPNPEMGWAFPTLRSGLHYEGFEVPAGFLPARHGNQDFVFARSRDGGQVAVIAR